MLHLWIMWDVRLYPSKLSSPRCIQRATIIHVHTENSIAYQLLIPPWTLQLHIYDDSFISQYTTCKYDVPASGSCMSSLWSGKQSATSLFFRLICCLLLLVITFLDQHDVHYLWRPVIFQIKNPLEVRPHKHMALLISYFSSSRSCIWLVFHCF